MQVKVLPVNVRGKPVSVNNNIWNSKQGKDYEYLDDIQCVWL